MACLPTTQDFFLVRDLRIVELTVEQCDRLERLMTDYLVAMAQYTDVPKDNTGQFRYPYLDHYWREPDRFPFILQSGEVDCGFALVRSILDPENGNCYYSMAEFFIAPEFRRHGLGKTAARNVMILHPGTWEVSVLKRNLPARAFWQALLTGLCPALTCEDTGAHYQYLLTV